MMRDRLGRVSHAAAPDRHPILALNPGPFTPVLKDGRIESALQGPARLVSGNGRFFLISLGQKALDPTDVRVLPSIQIAVALTVPGGNRNATL